MALITTVEPAHAEFFPSVEAIADAKAEIFLGVEPGDGVEDLPQVEPEHLRGATLTLSLSLGPF